MLHGGGRLLQAGGRRSRVPIWRMAPRRRRVGRRRRAQARRGGGDGGDVAAERGLAPAAREACSSHWSRICRSGRGSGSATSGSAARTGKFGRTGVLDVQCYVPRHNVPRSVQLASLALVIAFVTFGCGRRAGTPAGLAALGDAAGRGAERRARAARRAPRASRRPTASMGTEAVFTLWTDDAAAGRAGVRRRLRRDPPHRDADDRLGAARPAARATSSASTTAAGKSAVKVSAETIDGHPASRWRCRAGRTAPSTSPSRRCTACGSSTRIWTRRSRPPRRSRAAASSSTGATSSSTEEAHTVKLRRAGMRIGLGGIAKGYAVDRCAAVLRGDGLRRTSWCRRAAISSSRGAKGSANWMVGVRDPRGGPRAIIAKMPIQRPRLLDGRRLRALLRHRRQALPPHHRPQDRLPGDRVARA